MIIDWHVRAGEAEFFERYPQRSPRGQHHFH